jgi:hypothetical protein
MWHDELATSTDWQTTVDLRTMKTPQKPKKPVFTWTPKMIDRSSRIPPECAKHPFPGYRVSPDLAFRLAMNGSPNPKRAEQLVLRLLRDNELYLHNLSITLYGAAYRLGGGIS